jgi:L-ascorbate metabolism protein UlaG (beta-lactamase superfamily)
MKDESPRLTYIGGPTALIEWGGMTVLTDPTFDAGGTEYPAGGFTLLKITGPAIAADRLPPVDVVLLSHDHHADNLDRSGRALLRSAGRVVTTIEGAERLGPLVFGLAPWDSTDVAAPGGRVLRIVATPARHGPAHADRGPVVGFVLSFTDDEKNSVYVSGDTVWFNGVRDVSTRFTPRTAILFMGAARVPAVPDAHVTMTAADGVLAARAFSAATIVPLHYEGWKHFSESRQDIDDAFAAAGLQDRLQWLAPGQPTEVLRSVKA